MHTRIPIALLAAGALAAGASAQSFSYPDFSSTSNLTLNGTTTTFGTALRLTGNSASEKGSAWYDMPVSVDGAFDTTFVFQITLPVSGGADGIAFVIQNDPDADAALGDHASAMGYGAFFSSPTTNAVGNSLALEIDTFLGASWNDPNGNHLSLHTNGSSDNSQDEVYSIGQYLPPSIVLSDGQPHTVRLRYVPGTLDLFLDGVLVLTVPYSITTGGNWIGGGAVGGLGLIGGSSAYVGFTAANGGSAENHDILSWDWTSGAGPTVYCTAQPSSLPGCTPSISGPTATASLSAGAGSFDVTNGPVPGGPQPSILFYSTAGALMNPINSQFGFLCVTPGSSFFRVPFPSLPGGTIGNCDGSYTYDYGNYLATQTVDPNLIVGAQVDMQAWYRDPGAPAVANYSNAMAFTLVQ